jgi:glycolate oxidase FAD binding subunit
MARVVVERVDQICEAVRSHRRVAVRGGGSKSALRADGDGIVLDLGGLRGVIAYEPDEFTFTAAAGTPLAEIDSMLAEQGQYLPFDPPLATRGATLGGAVAAGVAGPGRFRYGGIRDFLIGIEMVTGTGDRVRGGGKVVKNAAGFDLPKLMVGSLGTLGALTELTFKVFPAPESRVTVAASFASVPLAVAAVIGLSRSSFDLDALDLAPGGDGATVWIRLGGLRSALPGRARRLEQWLDERHRYSRIEHHGEEVPPVYWRETTDLSWSGDRLLVRVPVTPATVQTVDPRLEAEGAERRYSAALNAAWVSWPGPEARLDYLLASQGLSGLRVLGPPGAPMLGRLGGTELLRRVELALDPEKKFPSLRAGGG